MKLRVLLKSSRLFIFGFSMLLGIGLACSVQGLRQARPWWGPFIPQFHLANGRPGTITVHVRDPHGQPVFATEVWITDTSGSSFARTGPDGTVEFHPNEDEIKGIEVDGLAILIGNMFCILHASEGADVYYIQTVRPSHRAGDTPRRALQEGLGLW